MKGQDKIDRMVAYINDKYTDDHFTFVSLTGGHLGSNVTKILVKSDKYPDKPIRVICTQKDDAEIFASTYLHVKYEEQTRDYIQNRLQEQYGDNIYVHYTPSDVAAADDSNSNTSFEEYLASDKTFISFSAVVANDAADEAATLDVVKSLFSDAVLNCDIYYIDKSVAIDEKTANQYMRNETYIKRLYLVKSDTDQYVKTEWVNGK